MHCANACRTGSSNTSFTAKSCACASITFLAGDISWSVESITADGRISSMPYLNNKPQISWENQDKFRITGFPAGHKELCEGGGGEGLCKTRTKRL